jgi:H2-forming N5,N10-methylenetetrahydromethanopterin dehydrogenase-like enzyme
MDTIDIEILEDGTISIKTSEISGTNHISADLLLDEIEELTGGQAVRKCREHEFWQRHKIVNRNKIVRIQNG